MCENKLRNLHLENSNTHHDNGQDIDNGQRQANGSKESRFGGYVLRIRMGVDLVIKIKAQFIQIGFNCFRQSTTP